MSDTIVHDESESITVWKIMHRGFSFLSPMKRDMCDGNALSERQAPATYDEKRMYNYVNRKRAAPVERFRKSKKSGVISSNLIMVEHMSVSKCCNMNCATEFSSEGALKEIYEQRNAFHQLSSQADRRRLLSNIVMKNCHGKLLLLGVRVCAKFIVNSLAISLNQVYGVLNRVENNLPVSAVLRRGPFGVTKDEIICGWLLELAKAHDPQPDKEFTILAHKRKLHVYEEYLADVASTKVPSCSFSYFCTVWKKNLGSRIVIRKCVRFAICDECSRIQKARESAVDRQKLQTLRNQEKAHLDVVKRERFAYAKRVREAINNGDDVLSIALDGADQGAYGLPYFSQATKQSGRIWKARQYLVGGIVHGKGIYLFRHLDVFPRGANVTIEVLHRMLEDILRQEGRLPKVLYLQLDNCWRENKNRYVFGFLSDLVQKVPASHHLAFFLYIHSRTSNIYTRGHSRISMCHF